MTSATEKSHIAQQLIANIKAMPLWVKQVIFLLLREDLMEHFVPESMNSMTSDDTVAFYIPKITDEGERVLLELKGDIGKFLMETRQKFTVLDICLRNEWSLEYCCQHLIECIKSQWIVPPTSIKAIGTIEYMANRIRLGEYLVKMGRINVDQLEQGLRTQQYIKEALQEHTGLANILINLGYITRQDTEGILFLKEESKKPMEGISIFEKLI